MSFLNDGEYTLQNTITYQGLAHVYKTIEQQDRTSKNFHLVHCYDLGLLPIHIST